MIDPLAKWRCPYCKQAGWEFSHMNCAQEVFSNHLALHAKLLMESPYVSGKVGTVTFTTREMGQKVRWVPKGKK